MRTYASRWLGYTVFSSVMALILLTADPAAERAFVVAAGIVATVGLFISGFCYRERLRQLDREPRLKAFRRMLK